MGIEELRRINSDIVHEDGSIDSFDRQLIDLSSGVYNVTNPMVVSPESKSIAFAGGLDESKPIVINVSTVIKLREKHQLGYAFVSRINEMLEKSYLAFDSLVQDTSRIFLLDEVGEIQKKPVIAICRYDKNIKMIEVHEITSIYERNDFQEFMRRTFEENKTFYCNDKTKASIKSHAGLQLPREIIDALSVIDYSGSFNKSQIKEVASRGLQLPLDILSPYAYDISSAVHNQVEKNELSSTTGEITKASIESSAGFQLPQETTDALSEVDYSKASSKSQTEDTTSVELEVIETQQEVVVPLEEDGSIEDNNSSLLENVPMEDDGIDFD
ncbi:hypothetical protein [Solobacterium moorei]|uniref:MuF-C-terminal domain-containing protein n=1 Tax=Solobacterium moorei TaxID=102148 RepID=UPI00040048DE|nr:hypothetical protein [Solobacterium moorei]BET20951.1 hypothetical protein RGT18_05390 [Solobacterium moorei]